MMTIQYLEEKIIELEERVKALEQGPSVGPTEHKPICDDCIYFDNGRVRNDSKTVDA